MLEQEDLAVIVGASPPISLTSALVKLRTLANEHVGFAEGFGVNGADLTSLQQVIAFLER